MTGAKTALMLVAALALVIWLAPSVGAQADPAQSKPAQAAGQKPAPPPAAAASKKPAKKSGPKAKKPPVEKPAPKIVETAHKRDPFEPLVSKKTGSEAPLNLPPGKAGLVISTLRVDGTVHGPNGMIAVVTNPQKRVYFIREGDHLYDGRVTRIDMDEVVFQQIAKDAFGKPVERQVSKRIYPSAGESQ